MKKPNYSKKFPRINVKLVHSGLLPLAYINYINQQNEDIIDIPHMVVDEKRLNLEEKRLK